MSWHYSQAQEEEFSVDAYLAGIRSARWSLSDTRANACCNGSETESCRRSLSGMTSPHLTENPGEGSWMSLVEDSHARTSVQQVKEPVLTEREADCGLECTESFAKYDHDSRSWRTLQCSLLGGCTEFSETWPKRGIMQHGQCSELETSEPLISATAFGFLAQDSLPYPCRSQCERTISITLKHAEKNARLGEPCSMWKTGNPWQTEPAVGRVADGVAHRVDRLKAIGNGQVPLVAAVAFLILAKRLESYS